MDMRRWINLIEAELPMDTASRMQRARDLGFILRAYHGTGMKFTAFDINKGKAGTTHGPAPHFADSKPEAAGYAKERSGGKGKTLEVLLRVHNPFMVDLNGPRRYIDKAEYQRLVGHPFADKFEKEPSTYKTLSDMEYATQRGPDMEFSREDAPNRRRWLEIYRRLMVEGYDALMWPNTMPDYGSQHYGKYIVFEPKNIRLTRAAFDPAKSESSDLMA